MNQRVLVIAPSAATFGPLFQLLQVLPELSQLGVEVHLAILRNEAGDEMFLKGAASYHACGARVASRRQEMAFIQERCAELQPDVVHLWGLDAARLMGWPPVSPPILVTHAPRPARDWPRWLRLPRPAFATAEFTTHDMPPGSAKRSPPGHRAQQVFQLLRSVRSPTLDRQEARARLNQQYGIAREATVICSVAPLIAKARIKDLIWALDLLACVHQDLYLLIAGTGTQDDALKRYRATMPIADRVIFLGGPPNVAEIVCAADIYWHAHLMETVPDAMLWAMSCGVPVVGAWGPQTETILLNQQTGLGVAVGRRDQLARWSKFVLEQPDRVQTMVAQAKQMMRESFSTRRAAERLIEVYRTLA